jgi:hypothetical protein
MSRFPAVCLLAVASLAGAAAGGRGDAPPFLAPSPAPLPATAIPLEGPPLVAGVLVPAPCHPMTLCEFASTFKPVPGSHEAWLINPVKGCPVKVCFNLPCGCPHVKVCKREIVFDYGCHAVKIHFGPLCGKVRVLYR